MKFEIVAPITQESSEDSEPEQPPQKRQYGAGRVYTKESEFDNCKEAADYLKLVSIVFSHYMLLSLCDF